MARLPLDPFDGLAMRDKVSNRDICQVRLSVDDTPAALLKALNNERIVVVGHLLHFDFVGKP
jgi:hypothetical protein